MSLSISHYTTFRKEFLLSLHHYSDYNTKVVSFSQLHDHTFCTAIDPTEEAL